MNVKNQRRKGSCANSASMHYEPPHELISISKSLAVDWPLVSIYSAQIYVILHTDKHSSSIHTHGRGIAMCGTIVRTPKHRHTIYTYICSTPNSMVCNLAMSPQ